MPRIGPLLPEPLPLFEPPPVTAAAVATVKLRLAGVGSVLPAASLART